MKSSELPQNMPSTAQRVLRSDQETDKYWESITITEPVSENLKALMRTDLKKAWHRERINKFCWKLKINWNTIDSELTLLKDEVGTMDPRSLEYMCNKPTLLYWLQSGQNRDNTGQRTLIPRIVVAGIFEEWYRAYDCRPNIEFGHFLANPIRITSTGPSDIDGVLRARSSICESASNLTQRLEEIEGNSLQSSKFSIHPLYPAIVMIIDRNDGLDPPELETGYFVSLQKFAQLQTVLLVRTGKEQRLSSPISFESLKAQALPIERLETSMNNENIVRVPLVTAVKFIVGLEKTENAVNKHDERVHELETRLCPFPPKGFKDKPEVCHNSESWMEAVMASAEIHGYNNAWDDAWASIRRVQAEMVGDAFCEFEPPPFAHRFRY